MPRSFSACMHLLDFSLKFIPTLEDTIRLLAHVHYQLGTYQGCIKLLNLFRSAGKSSSHYNVLLGRLYVRLGYSYSDIA